MNIKDLANYCLQCKNSPCMKGCPLGNHITDFIRLYKEDNYLEAYNTLLLTTCLSSVCGRICPHYKQCMGSCIRGIKGEPVNIGELEAYIGDFAIKNGYDAVASVFGVSKHKDQSQVDAAAQRTLGEIKYIPIRWDENLRQSIGRSSNFYRQNYCGCEFSFRKNTQNAPEIVLVAK